MRIVGGHDYYDSALAYGSDPSVVFVRDKNAKTELLKEPPHSLFQWDLYKTPDRKYAYGKAYDRYDLRLVPLIVYVAGVKWTGAKLVYRLSNGGEKEYYFWDYAALLAFLQTNSIFLQETSYAAEKLPKNHFEENGSTKDQELCIKNRIVIATYIDSIFNAKPFWRINGYNLKNFEFYRCMDPFRCYQEISMYVGGVLPKPGNPMVQITDQKMKAKKHGFDKWSFRKQGVNSILSE